MKMRSRFVLVTMGALVVAGCSGEPPEPDAADADPTLEQARREYRANCAACHGRNGKGAPHLYPPLRGETWAVRSVDAAVRVVLHGMSGELELEGVRYKNQMAPLGGKLGDEQIARILTYVRKSWGNQAEPVDAATVKRIRDETKEQRGPYDPAELMPLVGGD